MCTSLFGAKWIEDSSATREEEAGRKDLIESTKGNEIRLMLNQSPVLLKSDAKF